MIELYIYIYIRHVIYMYYEIQWQGVQAEHLPYIMYIIMLIIVIMMIVMIIIISSSSSSSI